MDADPPPPFAHDEEDEPERRLPARTPPPPKKPLDVFLAEFDRRLAEAPDQPATDAHLELEARAEGARKPPLASRRPAAATPADEPGPGLPPAPPLAAEKSIPEATAAPPSEQRRRPRGRRHRRRRH
jgi:hypothetical protein